MKNLESVGIELVSNSSPARDGSHNSLTHLNYGDLALEFLDGLPLRLVLPSLPDISGRWHPSGFIVFGLGRHPALGFLRLHVWPRSKRQAAPNGNTIHDHSWSIASRVVGGVYQDTLFQVDRIGVIPELDRTDPELLRLYTAPYLPDGSQTIRTDGTTVTTEKTSSRRVSLASTHLIEPGQFHRPTIPAGEFAATLVLSSFRSKPDGAYFVAKNRTGTSHEFRPTVSATDLAGIQADLMSDL